MAKAELNLAPIGAAAVYESVPCKESPLARPRVPVSGYGGRIPTPYLVQWRGRWRRVYCAQYGNGGSRYIGRNLATGIRVDIWQESGPC